MLYYPYKYSEEVIIVFRLKKYTMMMIIAALTIGISGCNSSNEVVLDSEYLIVEEPYVIQIYTLKTHSKDYFEIKEIINRTYEVNSKREFDRFVKKFLMVDSFRVKDMKAKDYILSSKGSLSHFDNSFFKNNKLYIELSNLTGLHGILAKTEISKSDNTLNSVLYTVPYPSTDDVKLTYLGMITVVNKEYAKDIEVVNTETRVYVDE